MSLGGQPKLGPVDYQRLFDPGFLQFVVLDPAKAKSTFEAKPDGLARDVKDALGRTQPPLPKEARDQFEGQIVMSLQRLDPSKSLADQVERAPRLVELMAHMVATVGGTGCAPEEFWAEIVLPLLFIGVPQQFPPLDEEELEAYSKGAEPLALFVDVVPHAHKAPEEGLLGAFEMTDIGLPHPSFSKVGALRLIQINPSRIKGLLEQFDPAKTMDAVKRFAQYLAEKSGKTAHEESPQSKEMLQAAMMLLTDLKKAADRDPGAAVPAPVDRGRGRLRAGSVPGPPRTAGRSHHPHELGAPLRHTDALGRAHGLGLQVAGPSARCGSPRQRTGPPAPAVPLAQGAQEQSLANGPLRG